MARSAGTVILNAPLSLVVTLRFFPSSCTDTPGSGLSSSSTTWPVICAFRDWVNAYDPQT
jgi:hypothetical protein